ncbi:MAG: FG-GAP repeat domain-containing protein [Planctomycetota bacterium]|jgi:hypothetical protein
MHPTHRTNTHPAFAIAAIAALSACGTEAPAVPDAGDTPAESVADADAPPTARGVFVDATEASGLRFQHDMGATEQRHLPETMGGGGALFDADRDGHLDAYLLQGGGFPTDLNARRDREPVNELFAGRGDGTFRDVTAESGAAASPYYTQGVAAGDVNGDGEVDLLVTHFGWIDTLLLGGAGFEFTDATEGSGLNDLRWTSGAVFFDADRDGDLDAYVAAYVEIDLGNPPFCGLREEGGRAYCSPDQFPGLPDRFYLGDGTGRFSEHTTAAGLIGVDGKGLGAVAFDLGLDGDLDLYVANDSTENRLWENATPEGGPVRFEDATLLTGTGVNADGMSEAGMGLAVGDLDGDLDLDLFVTNLDEESNTLYRNDGDWFSDATGPAGLAAPSRPFVGFGTVADDFDLDGDVDLAVLNGHIIHNIERFKDGRTWAQPVSLYLGGERGRFETADLGPLADQRLVGRGLLAGDLDEDGDRDLILLQCGREARVWLNAADPRPGRVSRPSIADAASPEQLHRAWRATLSDGSVRLLQGPGAVSYYASSLDLPLLAVPEGLTVESWEAVR